eukprot:CAMPEP_0117651376 /NCGR_PEP_ID=MMETSP0804-20121206/2059_1 /TAXON_ID=1074897 /ORGANISM="Tetraselmis astigmatica, Strain CCMP880" /LENGTH=325 /DNA_ID=CAMNT_0005457349 /DNA_START=160 /DNA_END=1137 /DNA_ORIENTATION=-
MAGLHSGGPPTLWQRLLWAYRRRFSHSPARDGVIYGVLLVLTIVYGLIGFLAPVIAPFCEMEYPDLHYLNPDFDGDPCLTTRFLSLGGLTLRECKFIRNIVVAVFLGSVIGYERRAPDRAAGIRSMSLTALGACCFAISSNFTPEFGPMKYDASRVGAAIPAGVGFLGAGIIWKGFVKSSDGEPDTHQVHGLTTAASVWLSAAIGHACGGSLVPQACFCVAGIVLMLRFGPRNSELVAEHEQGDADLDNYPFDQEAHPAFQTSSTNPFKQPLLAHPEISEQPEAPSQLQPMAGTSASAAASLSTRTQSFKLTRAPSKRRTLTTET